MSRSTAFILLIPISIAFAYGASLKAPFVYDDRIHILENEAVLHFQSIFDPESLQRIGEHAFGLSGRPLLFITYGMNYASSGANPESFRLTNLGIHLVNSILVFWIVLELSKLSRVALVASLLFATHPLLTESVTYIAGRSSSLCATFYFTGILVAMRAGRAEGASQTLLIILSLVSAVVGYLVKQDAVTLPLAMIAIFWIAWPESVLVRRKVVATAICALFLIFLVGIQLRSITAVQSTSQGNEALVAAGFEQTAPFQPYLLTSIEQLTTYYLWRMFLPVRLNVDPDPAVIGSPLTVGFAVSLVVLSVLALATISLRKRDRLLASGIALILVSPLGPYCFFPLADIVAEHRACISVLGAVIVLTACLVKLPHGMFVAAAVVLAFAWLTANRNTVWNDEVDLWKDASTQSPNKLRPHSNLGALYQMSGRTSDAIREYEFVLRRNPQHPTALSNLGSLYLDANDIQKAEDVLNRAVANNTTFAAVYLNLGVVRLRQGRLIEAREHLQRALTLNPRQSMAHLNLGDVLSNERHYDQAIGEYLAELQLNPGLAVAHLHLAIVYEAVGSTANAREHYLLVQKADPNNQEVRAALQRLQ